MDDKTLTALHGSIAKWEGIVDGTTEDEGPDNFPLCILFIAAGCRGCPVAEKTGQKYCEGTPYIDYCTARHYKDEDAMALAAQAELEFLQSLLPAP